MLTAVTITDLRPTDEVQELRARVRAFMEAHVYPNEAALDREDEEADALVQRATRLSRRNEGLWAPHLPPEAGGSNGSFLTYAFLNEEIGRSLWGQLAARLPGPGCGERGDPLAVRDGGAEGALAQAAGRRGDALVLLHDRAGRVRVGPDGAPDAGGAGR